MLEFQKSKKEQPEFAPYFAAQRLHISDFSLGFQFMWHDALSPEFAYAGGCLILREFYAGRHYFHYPLSISGSEAEESAALDEIERDCRDRHTRLHFTNVPKSRLPLMLGRYGADCLVTNVRRWRDYLYRAEDFTEYRGKARAGQRNHVNKFLKTYNGWQFRPYEPSDEAALLAFLEEYGKEQSEKGYLAREELSETVELVKRLDQFGLCAGVLFAEGKIVGFSVGERCGDMTVIHIEKANRSFEGAYPMLAQQFARAFCGDGVRFINRMDDAGDPGLRKSKLQYLPCEIVDKFNILPRRAIDGISRLPEIATPRLRLSRVKDADAAEYARLARDVVRNRYWGYDWRTDCDGEPEDEYFLRSAREDFKRKDEMPLGIYAEGRLAGEAVLHRFGYRGEVELGVRLLPEAEGKGYASEAMAALAEYAFMKLGLECAEAKCFRGNKKSAAMLLRAGFRPCGEDETYFYFRKTPEM